MRGRAIRDIIFILDLPIKSTELFMKYLIANAIKKIRLEKNISQEKLAQLSKISRRHMSTIESGETDIKCQTLEKISKGLKVNISDIYIEAESYKD